MARQICLRISTPAHEKLVPRLRPGQTEADWVQSLVYEALGVSAIEARDVKHTPIQEEPGMTENEKTLVRFWNQGLSLAKMANVLNVQGIKPLRAEKWTRYLCWWELDRLRKKAADGRKPKSKKDSA